MDRTLLRYFLKSGPTKKYDVLAATLGLIGSGGSDRFLFDATVLNRSIIFKYIDHNAVRHTDNPLETHNTLVFLPYNVERPEEGGEGFIHNADSFQRFFAAKFRDDAGLRRSLAADRERLDVLASLPTLSPYLIEDAFERAGLAIPTAYLDLTDETRTRIQARLRQRLRPVVLRAFEGTKVGTRDIEAFVTKIIEANDLKALMPLVMALRLQEDTALEAFRAWTGVTYFEDEYATLQPRLTQFAGWLTQHWAPREAITPNHRRRLASIAKQLRVRIRDDWRASLDILTRYRDSYSALVQDQNAGPLVGVLADARELFWDLGDILGRLEQSVFAWTDYRRRSGGEQFPCALIEEFYEVIGRTYAISDIGSDGVTLG
ncbi:MAG: hypothetical protein HXY25_04580 [Alphaproteobacteria bacterium]|nr:hypothetical protein [Alphaproteobacteria bacterium]